MIFKTGENMIQEQILENENNTNVTRGTEAVVAEVAALIVFAVFLLRNRTRYGY